MITLKTLPQATEQEVFDQVATHLLTQQDRSIRKTDVTSCVYRGINGTKCAAGCIIADDEYQESFDESSGMTWASLINRGIAPDTHKELITDLQRFHDNVTLNPVHTWYDGLKNFATQRRLHFNEDHYKQLNSIQK